MKEIEKYVGYYLLVYLIVLSICGFFQYMAVCQGKSLECAFSMDGINTIITTTAYVLTPIIAIIGFLSWRNQETYRKSQELIELILDKIRELELVWHESREYEEISRFQEYCARDILGVDNFDNLDFTKLEIKKVQKNLMVFDELIFLIGKFHFTNGMDISELDKIMSDIYSLLNEDFDDLIEFQQHLVCLRYGDDAHTLESEIEMRNLCDKFDRYCNHIMGRKNKDTPKVDYSLRIKENIEKIFKEIVKVKKNI